MNTTPQPSEAKEWSAEPQISRYVLGFLFRDNCTSVVLIRKSKPQWQAGLLNGVGGKIEAGETSHAAMVREFMEETGVLTSEADWREFAEMSGDGFCVACFTARNSAAWEDAETMEGEEVEKLHPDIISEHHCIPNLHWLIELALDENEGRHHFATIRYSEPYRLRAQLQAAAMKLNQLEEDREIIAHNDIELSKYVYELTGNEGEDDALAVLKTYIKALQATEQSAKLNREAEEELGDTLCDLKLWAQRHLKTGYAVAEIPDWELRQKLANIDSCIAPLSQQPSPKVEAQGEKI